MAISFNLCTFCTYGISLNDRYVLPRDHKHTRIQKAEKLEKKLEKKEDIPQSVSPQEQEKET
ncbi:MAG: hypothetical protein A2977_03905 [Alphaproteobacteria bacterium RIFCSPLOWO2_01_FULL_45_8]|nr:MAG: hypothetical protein A3K20_04820 [Alphaproteobacteria bacterium GWA1_45_9]OFW90283.1 MAG: hypothetical protein A2621_04815 [Alphaproteobacteria bacterium RIFCSPHIGHO2_01_FULL_41_14]OFW95661.1 MAG: hypothetical protein A2977_03905 [Alphaproteobacteria bacterium RIFCSPLOWO2_01_FULL_45_8]HCI48254.1 hypothetical protein [Holosporales bacterium]